MCLCWVTVFFVFFFAWVPLHHNPGDWSARQGEGLKGHPSLVAHTSKCRQPFWNKCLFSTQVLHLMPAHSTKIHVICCQRKPYFVVLESKSRKLMHWRCSFVCFFNSLSISASSLYILVLCGELLCPVMSLLCFYFIFLVFDRFPSLVLCVPAQMCTESHSVIMCQQRCSAATQTPS